MTPTPIPEALKQALSDELLALALKDSYMTPFFSTTVALQTARQPLPPAPTPTEDA